MAGPMSLSQVGTGWFAVLALFAAAAWATHGRRLNMAALLVCGAESLVLTLLAALWFGSLGSGGWPLLFLLLGLLVAGSGRGLRFAFLRSREGLEWGLLGADVVRYLLAGGLLAWRLG
jgi:hypothetical protein